MALTFALVGCEKPDTPVVKEATITSFAFLAEKNAENIMQDAKGVIDNANNISVTVPFGTSVTTLVASFETKESDTAVKVGEVAQKSGVTVNDFTNPVTYNVSIGDVKKDYIVTVSVLPEEEPEEKPEQ